MTENPKFLGSSGLGNSFNKCFTYWILVRNSLAFGRAHASEKSPQCPIDWKPLRGWQSLTKKDVTNVALYIGNVDIFCANDKRVTPLSFWVLLKCTKRFHAQEISKRAAIFFIQKKMVVYHKHWNDRSLNCILWFVIEWVFFLGGGVQFHQKFYCNKKWYP